MVLLLFDLYDVGLELLHVLLIVIEHEKFSITNLTTKSLYFGQILNVSERVCIIIKAIVI